MEDEIREKIALEIEKEIKPLIDGRGSLNAFGSYMLIMEIVKGDKK